MAKVEVQLMQRLDKTLYFQVFVSSEIRPGLMSTSTLEFENSSQAQHIGILVGSLAEYLCEKYSDTIEPSACAREGIQIYQELIAENPHVMLGDEPFNASIKCNATGRLASNRRGAYSLPIRR